MCFLNGISHIKTVNFLWNNRMGKRQNTHMNMLHTKQDILQPSTNIQSQIPHQYPNASFLSP